MGNNYGPKIVTDGLTLCLDANESKSHPGSGTTWTDLSGNDNTGTLQNNAQFATLNNRKTIAFDGTDDYVTTTNAMDFGGDFTFTSWFIQTGAGASDSLISLWTGGYGVGLFTYYSTTGASFATKNTSDHQAAGTTTIAQNTWYYLVGTRSNTLLSVYLNGELDGTKTTADVNDLGTITPWIGRMRSGQHELTGNIAATSIYNRAISATETKQNFNAHRSRFGL